MGRVGIQITIIFAETIAVHHLFLFCSVSIELANLSLTFSERKSFLRAVTRGKVHVDAVSERRIESFRHSLPSETSQGRVCTLDFSEYPPKRAPARCIPGVQSFIKLTSNFMGAGTH